MAAVHKVPESSKTALRSIYHYWIQDLGRSPQEALEHVEYLAQEELDGTWTWDPPEGAPVSPPKARPPSAVKYEQESLL